MQQHSTALEKATFAAGCFWCTQGTFEQIDGVSQVLSGYTGGHVSHPTYEQVCSKTTGHYEAIQFEFNPQRVPFEELLAVFWRQIDPTDDGGSFVDRGPQYRSAIFYHSEKQKELAEKSARELLQSGQFEQPLATKILPAATFYPAEEYHQHYHRKNPLHYKLYRQGSGRDRVLKRIWQ